MIINSSKKVFPILIFLCFFVMTSFAQTDRSAEVKEEITATERILTFTNVYGDNADDVAFFEDKVNRAKMEGVIRVTIDPDTQEFKAWLKKGISKRALNHFFTAVGYRTYNITK